MLKMWILMFGYFLLCQINGSANGEVSSIDLNRLQLVTADENSSGGRNYISLQSPRYNVDDGDSSGLQRQESSQKKIYELPSNSAEAPGVEQSFKVYKARENPKLYYRSEEFLQKYHKAKSQKSRVGDTSSSSEEDLDNSLQPMTSGELHSNNTPQRYSSSNQADNHSDSCVLCPVEETLIAKPGESKVLLEAPLLENCEGKTARGVRFVRIYGPRVGTLLEEGSHTIVGKIVGSQRKPLQYCRFRVEVIPALETECDVPVHLRTQCDGDDCAFTCSNGGHIIGAKNLQCLSSGDWSGALPYCTERTSCDLNDLIYEHGEIGCNVSNETGTGTVAQGSRCTIQCDSGYTPLRRRRAVCRRGHWSNKLKCVARKSE